MSELMIEMVYSFPRYIIFTRFNWDRKVKMIDTKELYENNDSFNYLSKMACWYLDMGLFETLEIILGEDLDIHFIE